MESPLPEKTTAPALENIVPNGEENPLADIEADMRTLMRRCGALRHELDEAKKNHGTETRQFLLNLLPVVDGFENVFHHIGARLEAADQQTKIWVGNFRTVYKLLLRVLKGAEVVAIDVQIGQKVNPAWHAVAETKEDPGRENETIVEEITRGYLMKGALLRPADVIVVKNE